MSVRCAQCGEELMGAVNRCWRCGTPIVAYHGQSDQPPVRRRPIVMPLAEDEPQVVAVLANDEDLPVANSAGQIAGDRSASDRAGDTERAPAIAWRVGSPFAAGFSGTPAGEMTIAPVTASFPITMPRYRNEGMYNGFVFAALIMGVMSLIAAFFTSGAVVLAVVGLLLGVCGLHARRRLAAVVAILLCCLALVWGVYQGIVFLYELRYGYKPWNAPSEIDEFETDPFDASQY
jgi:hypothetical protein